MDVVYAALIEDADTEQRQTFDEELALPLGVTREVLEKRRREAMTAAGWA